MSFGDSGVGVLVAGESLPILNGRQFVMTWLDAENVESVPSEFEGALPEPGRGFVSPALLEASGGPSGFRERFGFDVDPHNSDVLWDRVSAFAGEFLAFVTPPDNLSIEEPQGPQRWLVGFDAEALGAATPDVNQAPAGTIATFPPTMDERVPTPTEALTGGVFGLLVPALVVLGIGMFARSELRSHRREALIYLGASPDQIDLFDVAESAVLGVPVAVVISAVMWIILGLATALPFGTVEYLRGDLRPSGGQAAIAFTIALLTPVIMAVVVPGLAALRLRRRRGLVLNIGSVLLALPLVVWMIVPLIPQELSTVGFLAVLGSIVLVVPPLSVVLLPKLGGALASPKRVARLIAGRRCQWGDARSSDAIRITTLTVVAAVVVTAINLAAWAPTLETSLPPGIVTIDTMADLDGQSFVDFAKEVPGVPIGASANGLVYVATCEQVVALADIDGSSCATPERIKAKVERSLVGSRWSFEIGPPPEGHPIDQIIARVEAQPQADALQANANTSFGPSRLDGWDQLGPHPIIGWVAPLGAAAVGLFGVAVALTVVNTIRAPSRSDRALSWLATPTATRRSVLRWGFHSAVWLGVLLGVVYGLLAVSAGRPSSITEWNLSTLGFSALACGIAISTIVELLRGGLSPAGTERGPR
ncbi:MAG: hypothetical protein R2754_15375 [Microthrixaceae bacterium]